VSEKAFTFGDGQKSQTDVIHPESQSQSRCEVTQPIHSRLFNSDECNSAVLPWELGTRNERKKKKVREE
jgi:hypothetical protein